MRISSSTFCLGVLLILGIALATYSVLKWFADECERQCAKRRHPSTNKN